MAQPSRIPAWKRLGLKLKRDDQSHEQHEPEEIAQQHSEIIVEQAAIPQDISNSSIAPIETTKTGLGKRKHQDDPAEPRHETPKKSKSARNSENDDGISDQLTMIAAEADDQPASTFTSASSDARPKGDPNYRKKKEKKNKRNGQSIENAPAVKVAKLFPESNLKVKGESTSRQSPRTPSLSPGRLDPGHTLLASTETDFPPPPPKRDESSSSPPARVDRRKSVTFTPDTKTVDGNSASNLFKKWVQDQKASEEFTDAEVAQFAPPPKLHPANDIPKSSATDSKDAKKAKKEKTKAKATEIEQTEPTKEPPNGVTAAVADKKKDSARYLDYLTQFHTDKPHWKFNKAKQNDVLNNALNIFRIPDEHSDALIAYVEGLQGSGVIERLRQQCVTAIEEIEAAGTESEDTMDDPKVRKAAQEEALKENLTKQRQRRRLDRDIENFQDHPNPDGYIRRLKKGRAEALLKALHMAAPAPTLSKRPNPGQDKKAPKTKKMRGGEESSDESTDSSSSEESSSSEDESSDDDSGSGSASSSDGESSGESSSESDEREGSGSDSENLSHLPMALIALPTELVEHVAEHLDVVSFCAFRLACSSLTQQSLHRFRERFFRRRTLRWDTSSFHQLEDVTSHPHLGSSIEELVVDATPHFAIQLWKLRKGILDAQDDEDKRSSLFAERAITLVKADETARYWSETRHDQRTLISVFRKIKSLQSIIFVYDGVGNNMLLFGRIYCESSQNEMSRPFVSTLAALATANLTVRTLCTDTTRKHGAVSIGRLESISPILAQYDEAFLKLEVLQLTLRDFRDSDEGFELPIGRASFVVRCLAKFRNLRSLDLSCFSNLDGDILHEMARHCRYPHMEYCRLDLMEIKSENDLFRFLETSTDSLRALSLSHMILRDEAEKWQQVLRRVATDLALESLELKDLFAKAGVRIGFESSMRSTLKLEGPTLADELIQHANNLSCAKWGLSWHLAAVAYPFASRM
ncbi:hypothetical protein P280DRAFT_496248 [Massarina eburnea CBS 473.64]|uniref:F-box domain-containing protein n=1 Tax=Massarina eburnea CBS 473.64 TaxID=1395130 RepID=A0A6A6S8W9_9PLEO|nr:hypothetical protein P280DRAFT_496248 [Massarina eburnea CBS 473.64]